MAMFVATLYRPLPVACLMAVLASPALAQAPAQSAALPATAQGAPSTDTVAAAQTTAQPAAQTGNDDMSDAIVVTGLRGSLESAINARRGANGLTDSIFAKDIAAFPDTNLAESIQRIPGVQITRDAGEGRQIAVRGLNGDFTRVRLNGMEALATTGSSDQRGGVNRSRSFDLNIFASELFSRIDVVKARSAALDEGGIAATVDLHTLRPFDNPGLHVVTSAQAFYATRSDKVGPRAALVVSDTSADGVWGALVSAAYSRRQVIEDGHQTLRWQTGGWNLANVSPSIDPALRERLNSKNSDRLFYPRTPRYFIFDNDQKRLGLTGAFQFRPSDAFHVDLDMLYAKLHSTRIEHSLDAQSFTRTDATGLPQTTIRSMTVDGNDIVAAQFGNVDNRSDNRRDVNDTKFHQVALTTTWKPADRLTVDALIGIEGSDYRVDTRTFQLLTDNHDFSYDYRDNDRVPAMTYGVSLTDPTQWRLDLYRPNINIVKNDYRIGKLNVAYDVNGWAVLKAGGAFTRYIFDTVDFGQDSVAQRGRAVGDLIHTDSPYRFGKALGGVSGTPREWLFVDFDKALPLIDPTRAALTQNHQNDRRVKEEVLAGYAQVDLKSEIAGMPIRGDVGVRVARTQTTATGARIVTTPGAPTVIQPVTVDRTYTDWLPSANLVLEMAPKVQLRFSANRNITRPTLTSLTPGGQVQVNTRTVSVGNPELDPFRADSVDLALEWYPTRDGFFAIGPFYKRIKSFIGNQTTEQTYAASGYPIALLGDQKIAQPDNLFLFSQPVNGPGTSLKGIEVIAQQAFTFLPGALRNFGGIINYTRTSSNTNYPIDATTIKRASLLGLSKQSANATLYYETKSYGGRVSANYRGRYLTAVPGANNNDIAGVNAATYVDASLFWNVTDRFTMTLEGVNLTNQAEDQFVDTANRVSSYSKSGRQLMAGVRWRM